MGGEEFAWVLEDDAAIQRLITLLVKQEGLTPIACSTSEELMLAIGAQQRGVVILDIGVPAEQGLEAIANVKTKAGVPVLAMTAAGQEVAARAVEFGADDFLSKPFDPDDLVRRVQFLLGRPEASEDESGIVAAGKWRIDLQARTLSISDKAVWLSKTEWDILRSLALQAGQPVLQSKLSRGAFDGASSRDNDLLKQWIDRLQNKLGCNPDNPTLLKPIHDIAYTLAFTRLPES